MPSCLRKDFESPPIEGVPVRVSKASRTAVDYFAYQNKEGLDVTALPQLVASLDLHRLDSALSGGPAAGYRTGLRRMMGWCGIVS